MSYLMRSLATIALLALALALSAGIAGTIPRAAADPSVELIAWKDLPRDDRRSQELSGIAWDETTSTLYAITDDAPRIVPLVVGGEGFSAVTFGDEIAVTIHGDWDGEGIARTSTGFFMSNENGPHIYELDQTGQMVSEVRLPDHFSRSRQNASLESLALTADGQFLFTANEQSLNTDGPRATIDAGTLVRIVRYDRSTQATQEWTYLTDPIFARGDGGDNGVVDLAALSASEVLVLERSFVPRIGNSVRVYRVSLDESSNVVDVDALSAEMPILTKTLVVDLGTLPDDNFPPSLEPQRNRILDNYEGLALGPMLGDGRRVLFLVSDDNKRASQVPRLLVLAVSGL
jgi:hypothetical protein